MRLLNRVGDAASIVAAVLFAATHSGARGDPWLLAGVAAAGVSAWTFGARVIHQYVVDDGRTVRGDVGLTGMLVGGLVAVLALARALVPGLHASLDLVRFAVLLAVAVTALRLACVWTRMRDRPADDVLILGTGPLGRHTGLEIRDARSRQHVVGYLAFADDAASTRLPAPILGDAAALERVLRETVVCEVYIAGNAGTQRDEMQHAIAACERFGVPFAIPAGRFRFARARPEHDEAVVDGYLHYLCVRNRPVQRALKRAIDVAASLTALVLLTPLLLVIAVLVKTTSRGPMLFRQPRVGLHGRVFWMLKFRSMVSNAEELKAKLLAFNEQSGPVFKLTRDPRVTAVGRFIRKHSLDELPQLVNVLRGDMTIVGPRPPVPSEVARYEAWQRRRLSVRPGLTCVWQVSGRNQISFEEWMYLDMRYIDHWTLAEDIRLILRTVPVVVTGRGAS